MNNTVCNKNNIRELYVNLWLKLCFIMRPQNDADRYHKNY